MKVQDAFLAQLERIWAPKRVPKGAQDEPKTDPRRVQNRSQNRIEKMIEKWTAQSSMTGIDGGHARPQVPTGGVWGGLINELSTNTQGLTRQWADGPANFQYSFGGFSVEFSRNFR